MGYLRMVSNSLMVGFVAAVYVTLLFVLLNPSVPVTFGATMPLLLVVSLSYGVLTAAATYAAFLLRQMARFEPLWPAWVSLRMLAWSSGAAAAAVAVILALNARGFRTAIDASTLQALNVGAVILAATGGLLLALALTRTFVQRGPWVVGTFYAVTALCSIAGPLVLRDRAEAPTQAIPAGDSGATPVSPDAPRVIGLLLDGASLDIIAPAVAAGRLPNFGRLLDGGASMHLATTRPTQAEPVWASVMTGKWPAQHGIRGASVFRPFSGGHTIDVLPDLLFTQALVRYGFLLEEPHAADSMRAVPLWHILSRQGLASGIIGLPLTQPVVVSPRGVDDAVVPALRQAADPAPRAARLELLPQTGESGSDIAADRRHHGLATDLGADRDLRLLVVRYAGLDAVAHYYLRYATPDAFGDVSEDERQRFGRVLDEYYAYVDALVGDALTTLRRGDLLLVVSGFGMEPLSPGKRLLERVAGNPAFSGTHERAPDGFLLAFGSSVARGRFARGALVDVTPTLLYFLDRPVARDMSGFARTDLFTDGFNAQRTITFIPTYDR